MAGQDRRAAQARVRGEQGDVEVADQCHVERVVMREVVPQGPGSSSMRAGGWIAVVDKQAADAQRGSRLPNSASITCGACHRIPGSRARNRSASAVLPTKASTSADVVDNVVVHRRCTAGLEPGPRR
ncbi:hypothetical protein H7H78_01895 [Mycobacterium shinjukuense]|uniref:hypothetical protein n=1 Tax=Mycobacterium shinjukuense TaxID=398694 RepID=UPI001301E353|nr:hypothetical protein [Mycobacterium shinjukuense]MCV6984247.1 hypothetical protein [Mycobacterium shinjukuense]